MNDVLSDLHFTGSKSRYRYKNIEFLTNLQEADILVVIFHASRSGQPIPIFRGHNYSFLNTNVLSIADPLYEKYQDINIGWYLDTQKCQTTENVLNIVKSIKKKSGATKILFVAQCAGCLIAMKLGCMLNEYVLITNPHLILKAKDINYVYPHWTRESLEAGHRLPLTVSEINTGNRVKILNQALIDNEDSFNENELDVRQTIKKYGFPKRIVAYTHSEDYTVEGLDLLEAFLGMCNYDQFTFIKHNKPCDSPHHTPFFGDQELGTYIGNLLGRI